MKKVKAIERSLFPDIKAIDLDDFFRPKEIRKKKKKKGRVGEGFPKKKTACCFFLAQKITSSQGESLHE